MGLLKSFSSGARPAELQRLPSGCFTLHRGGEFVASTLPSAYPQDALMEIGRVVLEAFRSALECHLPLADLHLEFSGLTITARELRGGALVFLEPATLNLPPNQPTLSMHYKTPDEFILHLENYIECWKQFNHYVNLARDKKFSREDETQFLEIKSLIAQGLEAIIASADKGGLRKDDVHQLFANAPSLRYLADNSGSVPTVEGQWHRVYLTLQSLLGQTKVQQNKVEKGTGWSLFGRK